jgi:glycine amidinotransferase
LQSWDILVAPEPDPVSVIPLMCSKWISMNMLILDEQWVIVERLQESLVRAFKDCGLNPFPVRLSTMRHLVGYSSFHCATLNLRRRGRLKSYF